MKTFERERHNWLIIPLILALGFLCVILAAQWALRLSPSWELNTNMESRLDPNGDFLTRKPEGFIEPVDPLILTPPAWMGLLDPGTVQITRTPFPTAAATRPAEPTTISYVTPTAAVTTSPTDTVVLFPWLPSSTSKPKQPTNTNVPTATSTPVNTPLPGTPLPPVDLQITKSDGVTTYMAGGSLTYTITATNNSSVAAAGVLISDNIPAQVASWTWSCTSQNGGASSCDGAIDSSTNFSDNVNLPGGASIVYTVNVTVSAGASGNLTNTVTITLPGYADPVSANNSATDTDTQIIAADLSITKTDGVTVYTAGSTLTYTIVASNPLGPGSVNGATVTDTFPAKVSSVNWTCAGAGGAVCTANGSGNINDSVNLPAGSSITYTVKVTIDAGASGDLVNTASVSLPAGYTDPVPANNVFTDTDTNGPAVADLQISITDNATTYIPGSLRTYWIVVSNSGPGSVNGATVTDIFPAQILTVSGSCTGVGGAVCGWSGSSNISDLVNLPASSSVTYEVHVTTDPGAFVNLANTASVTGPAGYTESIPGDESRTDTDTLLTTDPTPGQIGSSPGGGSYNLTSNSSLTLTLSTPLTVGAGNYLVYYEMRVGSGMLMDQVRLELSDGYNWYPIFNWGGGGADTNSNVNIALIGGSEDDNRDFSTIPESDILYPFGTGTLANPATGVTIQVDGVIPNGIYPYIRIITPSGDSGGDGCDVDAIQILP